MSQESAGFNNSEDNSGQSEAKGDFACNGIIQDIAGGLYSYNVWIKILAVLMIIVGVIFAITLIGIIIAWIPIWVGVILWRISNNIKNAATTGQTAELEQALSNMNLYFKIAAIGLLVMAAVYVILIITGISLASSSLYTTSLLEG